LAAGVEAGRGHAGQQAAAANLRALLAGSRRLRDGAAGQRSGNGRLVPVQDAYTLRCVPQVLGAVRATVAHVRDVVEVEVGSVTDNPTFFPEDDAVLHAGNFHGQPVALAVELLAVAEAVDLVGAEDLGAGTSAVYGRVRELVPPLLEDRPLGADVERLAGALGRVAG